jgi:hypothetical protein
VGSSVTAFGLSTASEAKAHWKVQVSLIVEGAVVAKQHLDGWEEMFRLEEVDLVEKRPELVFCLK